MPFIGYERITVSSTPLSRSSLTVPSGTVRVAVQADTQNVRYVMAPEDTEPSISPGQSNGMVFVAGLAPEEFNWEDFQHISFVRGAGSDGFLNVHYYTARIIP